MSPAAKESVSARERRRQRRAKITAPVRVRTLHLTQGGAEVATTLDVTRDGIYFETDERFYRPELRVTVQFPFVPGPWSEQNERPGRVARVVELDNGRRGVAVSFLSVGSAPEILPTAAGDGASDAELLFQAAERPRVIVVEDDARVREQLRGLLAQAGYAASVVRNCDQARALLGDAVPAVAVVDVGGGDRPGYHLAAAMKSDPRLCSVPVVLLTRSALPSDYGNAHLLGAAVCMTKPYKPERLVQVLRLLAPPGRLVSR